MLKSRLDKPYSCFDGACNPENPTHWLKEFIDSDADIYLQPVSYTHLDVYKRQLLDMKPSELAGQVGTVFQDPRSQFFMTDTTRELAFGCENLGLTREETISRIAKSAKELELVDYLNRSIFAL